MVSGFVFENAKTEKLANAMWSSEYRTIRKFWKFLPFIEALVAVIVLLSWLTPPLASVKYLRQLAAGWFNQGIFTFALVNVLIAVIFLLSHLMKPSDSDLYDRYVPATAASTAIVGGSSTVSAAVSGSVALYEADDSRLYPVVTNRVQISPPKQAGRTPAAVFRCHCPESIVEKDSSIEVKKCQDLDNIDAVKTAKTAINRSVGEPVNAVISAGDVVPVRREMARVVSSVGEETSHVRRGEMAVLPVATDESQIYRRTRSERMDRREDRRRIEKWSDMDDLSSEEFRTTIETFIAAQKKTLLQETMEERGGKADVAKRFR